MNIWHDIDPKRITPTDFMAFIDKETDKVVTVVSR
jgi:hypothetical protein